MADTAKVDPVKRGSAVAFTTLVALTEIVKAHCVEQRRDPKLTET